MTRHLTALFFHMRKHILGSIVIAAIFIVGAGTFAPSASALSVSEIQTQIQQLLSRIADLRAQSNVQIQSPAWSTGTTVSSSPSKHRICAVLYRNLSQGTRGDDVMSLQEFLQTEGYLSANATGYFGPLTAQAVVKWQASQGVSAVGAFGPVSRERIRIWCGGASGGPVGNIERFNASPTRGNAPLTVTFSTWLSGFRPNTIYYTIDFGDGTSERAANCYAPADACLSPGQNVHTYTQNGTYTATLNKITDPCPDDGDPNTPRCLAPIQSEVVAKAQIAVGPVACTKEYIPVCGSKPIVCITTPCNPIQQTYGNRCEMAADGATFLYEGQCRANTTDPAADPRCKAWYDGCNSCSRETPTSLATCTLRACFTQGPAYCTAYFDGTSSNKPPTISSFSGPTTLAVNASGTWAISATDPENGPLTYQVWWGDENVYAPAMNSAASTREFVQTTTFTHAYANSGTYTVTIIVRDSSGQEAKTTSTVNVGSQTIACPAMYQPVCGRPAGCANTCAPGMYCTMICQLHNPVTYSSMCHLNASGASFLYDGVCTSASGSVY
ncbi:hypothetical protein COU18_00585 [Candidatus Kaiserbacteria bacterium CG10_big_fil_rev_8_21_14_0_10_51_14]|uniref:PKD domain-containing protein n=1 Tax=Candidatus Kaiserbacteria bacterium CG10_big_fil_rev_8_21_14_0_10_51_14 TaxID=1974610 RepID=A0A2H0UCT8_9BACT|nr:MAG: hypothetical protein COU18_00585 [Candidatus Kaiserbacteria bacterium CG10_big_fil_rev_8_21_14_0_10_51_14]